jgi:hypothetical protein
MHLTAYTLDLLFDADSSGFEVDVLPAKPEDFATAQPIENEQDERRVEWVGSETARKCRASRTSRVSAALRTVRMTCTLRTESPCCSRWLKNCWTLATVRAVSL